jgi:2-methylcitrate dehydratase PrpD
MDTALSDAALDRSKVTQVLADFVVRSEPSDVPDAVYTEAVRSFLNWGACAVGGSIHPRSTGRSPRSGPSRAGAGHDLWPGERIDGLHAALLNGISSHVFDFDDTHLKTIIHPAGPIASALLPLAEARG